MREPTERMKSFLSGFQSPKTRKSLRRKAKLEVSQQGVSYVNISHPYEPSSSLNSPRRIRQHEKVLMEAANELAQCRQQIKTYNSLPHVLRRVIYADIVNHYPRMIVISPNLLVFETRLKRKKQRGIQTEEEADIINISVISTFRAGLQTTASQNSIESRLFPELRQDSERWVSRTQVMNLLPAMVSHSPETEKNELIHQMTKYEDVDLEKFRKVRSAVKYGENRTLLYFNVLGILLAGVYLVYLHIRVAGHGGNTVCF